jgi:N-acetylmuramoyl-L-alanine amidase
MSETQLDIRDRPSPNFDARPAGKPIDILVLHYTGMQTAAGALERLCDPAAKVSAHYTLDEDGTIYRHVHEEARAWHAGVSFWAGETDINGRSIGIELVNPGHEFGYRAFPDTQIRSLISLARKLQRRHSIPAARVLGHSDVAPQRKLDPGELFPWETLASEGIAIGTYPTSLITAVPRVDELQRDLADFGYGCPQSGKLDPETVKVIEAFQRHFRANRVDGIPDGETAVLARQLARAVTGANVSGNSRGA